MRYYTICDNNNLYDKYVEKSKGNFAWITFCEQDFEEIYQTFKLACVAENIFDEGLLQAVNFEFVGEDNYLYRMSYATGEVSKVRKWSLKKVAKQYEQHEKVVLQVEKNKQYIQNNYQEDTLIHQKSFIPYYQKYKFVDRDNLINIPFRFKKSSKKCKIPLVIYFHGAGAIGEDNIAQFIEYKSMCLGLSRMKCHVLVPQNENDIGENICIIKKYCHSINKLVEKLSDIVQIDFDRIYLIGASYGGACTWYSMYEFPNFYAASIPLMGYFPEYNSTKFDIKCFEKEKIWIGHSQNDNVVSIKDDEEMYKRLKTSGYNVRMTVYQKYGHSMCGVFARKEKWKKWLFEQKR